jgi:hypothetical protein
MGTLPKSQKRKSFCQDQDQDTNLIVPDKRRKRLQGERIMESQFKPNEDFNQTISFGSAIETLRDRKPRRVVIDQEHVNYENFAQSIPNSFNGKFTSTTRIEKRDLGSAKKTPFGDVTNRKEFKKRNLNMVIMELKEASARGESEPDGSSHVDFRSLGTQDFNRHSVDIENFLTKICSVNMLSLLDENFSGLDFE